MIEVWKSTRQRNFCVRLALMKRIQPVRGKTPL
jgi:hypothetical protein